MTNLARLLIVFTSACVVLGTLIIALCALYPSGSLAAADAEALKFDSKFQRLPVAGSGRRQEGRSDALKTKWNNVAPNCRCFKGTPPRCDGMTCS